MEYQENEKKILFQFIKKYKSLPELWDTSDDNYNRKATRLKALDSLGRIYRKIRPEATREDVKKKINSMRSNYRKELRKVMTRNPNNHPNGYKPKIWWYKYLSFIDGNLNEIDELTDNEDIIEQNDNKIESFDEMPEFHTKTSIKIETEMDNPCEEIVQGLVTALKDCQNEIVCLENEEYGKIGKLISEKLSKVDQFRASEMMIKIMQILHTYNDGNPKNPNNYK